MGVRKSVQLGLYKLSILNNVEVQITRIICGILLYSCNCRNIIAKWNLKGLLIISNLTNNNNSYRAKLAKQQCTRDKF